MFEPLTFYALVILSIHIALLAILVVNLRVLPRLEAYRPQHKDRIKVAVLVPARNEETNIENCLYSLLAQTHPDVEVWLYDDGSTDSTPQIASRLAAINPRLRVVTGDTEPPQGWLGKAHACYRLYREMRTHSQPDYVLFTDADVRFKPNAVAHAVTTAQSLDAGLLSVFPMQRTVSWAERLAVPLFLHWAVYTFLPLPIAFNGQTGPAFAAANGQFMLFKREAYEACGGHEGVRSDILEDVALARRIKRAGYKAILADGGALVETRMYNGPDEVWRGYSKNAYAFFGYSPFFLAIGLLVFLTLYIAPIPLALYAALSGQYGALPLLGAHIAVPILARLLLSVRFRYRVADTILHPFAILFMIAILLNSARWAHTGKGAWKGRSPVAK